MILLTIGHIQIMRDSVKRQFEDNHSYFKRTKVRVCCYQISSIH